MRGFGVPHYQHDCNYCVYLGSIKGVVEREEKIFDLYVREGVEPVGHVYIARFGHDAFEYLSAPNCVVKNGYPQDHPIAEAKRRDDKRRVKSES
jgi:hypothetical protein